MQAKNTVTPKSDISNMDDIRLLVDRFYDQVREDPLIGGIFNRIIENRWPEHLEKMYRFWQTVLLREHTYYGTPFKPHATLPVQEKHFDRWKKIFTEVLDEYFVGPKAEEAKWRAERMAQLFQAKIAYYQKSHSKPLL